MLVVIVSALSLANSHSESVGLSVTPWSIAVSEAYARALDTGKSCGRLSKRIKYSCHHCTASYIDKGNTVDAAVDFIAL
jgi:hypothetical protein